MKYRMVIEWNDEEDAYVVFLPEWQGCVYQAVTDGATYEGAAQGRRRTGDVDPRGE